MELILREAVAADLRQINLIARQVHDLHVELRGDIYVSRKTIIPATLFAQFQREGLVFVGEIAGKIVSYAVCYVKDWANPLMRQKKVMVVDALCTDAAYREQGIGRKMMTYISEQARRLNCERLELQVLAVNKKAREFYSHLGLREKFLILEQDL